MYGDGYTQSKLLLICLPPSVYMCLEEDCCNLLFITKSVPDLDSHS